MAYNKNLCFWLASHSISRLGPVAPHQEAQASVQLLPRAPGSTVLLVDFHSDKLKNVKNFITVNIKE